MRCQDIRQLLSAHLDGTLDSAQNKIVEDHLTSCRECRLYWQALRADAQLLRDLPEVTPPPGFRAELFARLRKLENEKRKQSSGKGKALPFISGLASKPWFTGIAAAVLIFVFGLTTFGGGYLNNIISPDEIYHLSDIGNIVDQGAGAAKTGEEPVYEPGEGGPASEPVEPSSDDPGEFVGDVPGGGNEGDSDSSQQPGDSTPAGGSFEDDAPDEPSGEGGYTQPGTGTGTGEGTAGEKAAPEEENDDKSSSKKEVFVASGDEIKIVRRVQVGVIAGDIDRVVKGIKDIAGLYGGFPVGDDTVTEDGLTRIELAVPAAQLHHFMREVENYTQVYQQPQNDNKDVTEKYNNLVNTIQKLTEEENQLAEQLAGCPEDQKAELESKIESIRQQLEEKRQEKELLEKDINNAVVVVKVKHS